MLRLVTNDFSATCMMENKRNTSKEKRSKFFKQRTSELRTRSDIMRENVYSYVEGKRMGKQLVASHCLKEDIEGKRKVLINFLLEMRFSIR